MASTDEVLSLRLGTFNAGVDQAMLSSKRGPQKVAAGLERIISTCVQEGMLDVFCMCEVGGRKAGLKCAAIHAEQMTVFSGGAQVRVTQNYLTSWEFRAVASQRSVQLLCEPFVLELTSTKCQPQLVVSMFNVHDKAVLVLGNLHIRTPQGTTVTRATRKRTVGETLQHLETNAANKEHLGGSQQPIVYVLVGDCNLEKDEGEEATQPLQQHEGAWSDDWHVHGTQAQKGGDILFVKGAHASLFELPVGVSHSDRGIRHDNHDAFGVELRLFAKNARQPDSTATLESNKRMHSKTEDAIDETPPPVVPKQSLAGCVSDCAPRTVSRRPSLANMLTDDASQLSANRPGRARNAITHNVTQSVWKSISDWWSGREDGQRLFKETKDLQRLLFSKRQHAVPEDLWIPGAAPHGETQHVAAVVSEQYAVSQLREVIRKREEWLEREGLPMNFQMRDGPKLERERFLQYVKAEYHAEPYQMKQQERDAAVSNRKKSSGMHSRWGREMQRRCGSKVLWEIISFTGKFSVEFLTEITRADAPEAAVQNADSHRQCKARAVSCRGRLRGAQHLDRKRQHFEKLRQAGTIEHHTFSKQDQALLDDLDTGKLRREANEATKAFGHGRIRMADGTYADIGSGTGGLTRTILDGFIPPLIALSSSEEDKGADAEEEEQQQEFDEDAPVW